VGSTFSPPLLPLLLSLGGSFFSFFFLSFPISPRYCLRPNELSFFNERLQGPPMMCPPSPPLFPFVKAPPPFFSSFSFCAAPAGFCIADTLRSSEDARCDVFIFFSFSFLLFFPLVRTPPPLSPPFFFLASHSSGRKGKLERGMEKRISIFSSSSFFSFSLLFPLFLLFSALLSPVADF